MATITWRFATLKVFHHRKNQNLNSRDSSSIGFLSLGHNCSTEGRHIFLVKNWGISPRKNNRIERNLITESWSVDGPSQDVDSPTLIELQPIVSEEQFDRVIAEAQQLEESVIIVWMASWCRKCIYLKPKLEKLAPEYYPRIRFYCINVNTVPQRLVNHAGITKMPTIQLWKDCKKQAEVIGGHKAWLVVNDVREMIENEC